jgi:hypothetical protein
MYKSMVTARMYLSHRLYIAHAPCLHLTAIATYWKKFIYPIKLKIDVASLTNWKKSAGWFDRVRSIITVFDISVLLLVQCLQGGGVGRHARHAYT